MLRRMKLGLPCALACLLCLHVSDLHAQSAPPRAPEQLRLQLKQVEAERADTNNLLPWLTVALGGGTVVGSAIAGSIHAIRCEPGCTTPNWVAFAVVAGGLVAILGGLWVIHRDNDIRELDSRRYQLQEELLHFQHAQLRRERAAASDPTWFSLSARF
jgi:hypothetical protein